MSLLDALGSTYLVIYEVAGPVTRVFACSKYIPTLPNPEAPRSKNSDSRNSKYGYADMYNFRAANYIIGYKNRKLIKKNCQKKIAEFGNLVLKFKKTQVLIANLVRFAKKVPKIAEFGKSVLKFLKNPMFVRKSGQICQKIR